ncbi:archaemetzincin-1-like isoform X2 [Anguilla anguilla]|uniref:archaemetzincin-1-like isoform X2 n=1 Tax=Anguilla anguilla TaxID=7936 RepID=UPI0015A99582|nr:archaemetzincin-1-like isoform X2 [Anguilla anguilla]
MLQHRHVQEFCLGPPALKEALISSNAFLKDLYSCTYSHSERLFLSEAYNPNRVLFQTLLIRTPFDWIVSHPEEPQDFESFYNSTQWHQCNSSRKKIYLQPIDVEELKQGAGISFLDDLKSYLEAFFLGFPVMSLPSISTSSMKCRFRQNELSCKVQLHTGVGVCSFSRLLGGLSTVEESGMAERAALVMEGAGGRHDRRARPAQPHALTATELLQCCKVVSHEVCRLAGLQNCRWLRCIMQGVASPEESLLRPMHLCPICLRKLHYALGFSLLQRYRRLQAWCHHIAFTWTPRGRTRHVSTEIDYHLSCDIGVEGTPQPVSATLELSIPAVSVSQNRLHGEGSGAGAPLPPAARTQGEGLAAMSGVELYADLLGDYEAWLDSCMRALQVEVPEDELSQLDRLVDAMKAPRIHPARAPSLRASLEPPREEWSVKRVVGQKFAQLLRKLRFRQLRTDHSHDDSED